MRPILLGALLGAATIALAPAHAVTLATLNFNSTVSGTYDRVGIAVMAPVSFGISFAQRVDLDALAAGSTTTLAPVATGFRYSGASHGVPGTFYQPETFTLTYSNLSHRLTVNTPNMTSVFDLDLSPFVSDPMHAFYQTASPVTPTSFLSIPDGGTVRITSGQGTLTASVPEPATWAMTLVGFGTIGLALRQRRRAAALA